MIFLFVCFSLLVFLNYPMSSSANCKPMSGPLSLHNFSQIAFCPGTSTVVAVYMCDQPALASSSSSSYSPPPPPPPPPSPSTSSSWPDGAHIQASYGIWNGLSREVAWSNQTLAVTTEVPLHPWLIYTNSVT
jgi:hypothetical protein